MIFRAGARDLRKARTRGDTSTARDWGRFRGRQERGGESGAGGEGLQNDVAMLTYTGRAEAEWIRAEGDSTRDVGEMGMVQREGTVAAAVGDGRSESVRRGSARRKREEEDVNSDSGGGRRSGSYRVRGTGCPVVHARPAAKVAAAVLV